MSKLFNKIKNAPIGTELVYRGRKGIVTVEPDGARWECEDCLYMGSTCLLVRGNDSTSPCWDSVHCSGKLIIVRPIVSPNRKYQKP